jgi:glycosyltransferase involved in cell wall biosynthesis
MMLKHLALKNDVTLVTFNQGGVANPENIKAVRELGVNLYIVPLDPIRAGMRALALSLFTNQPLEIAYYNQPEFGMKVDELIKKNKFDLGISFFMRTAEYLKNHSIKKMLMAEDCRTVYQMRSFKQSSSPKQKIIRWWEYRKLQSYEPEIMNYFDASTFVTQEDIEHISLINPKGRYCLLTNGTNIEKFVLPSAEVKRDGILFAGKLDIWANVLMINRINERIMPLIREKFPSVKFRIVGANPSKSILSLKSDNVLVEPNVPDMVPYLQSAQVFVHPHDGGSGIQNKLLEAMACGCPVVTTSTGSQGLHPIDEDNIMIAGNDREFADKVIQLLHDNELANRIGLAARKTIEDNLSWQAVNNQIDEIINQIIQDV